MDTFLLKFMDFNNCKTPFEPQRASVEASATKNNKTDTKKLHPLLMEVSCH